MEKNGSFPEIESYNKYFSVDYFNKAWGFLDKPDLSKEEKEKMVFYSVGAMSHWIERNDIEAKNFSIGYWQISRVFSEIGLLDSSLYFAECCLEVSKDLEPFYKGYALEAMARVMQLKCLYDDASKYLSDAKKQCEKVEDQDSKSYLLADLESVAKLKGL